MLLQEEGKGAGGDPGRAEQRGEARQGWSGAVGCAWQRGAGEAPGAARNALEPWAEPLLHLQRAPRCLHPRPASPSCFFSDVNRK